MKGRILTIFLGFGIFSLAFLYHTSSCTPQWLNFIGMSKLQPWFFVVMQVVRNPTFWKPKSNSSIEAIVSIWCQSYNLIELEFDLGSNLSFLSCLDTCQNWHLETPKPDSNPQDAPNLRGMHLESPRQFFAKTKIWYLLSTAHLSYICSLHPFCVQPGDWVYGGIKAPTLIFRPKATCMFRNQHLKTLNQIPALKTAPELTAETHIWSLHCKRHHNSIYHRAEYLKRDKIMQTEWP